MRNLLVAVLLSISGPAIAGSAADHTDFDNDGVVGPFIQWGQQFDNCPTIYNPDQSDLDRDASGDVCDPCPLDHEDLDSDENGITDVCEFWQFSAIFGAQPFVTW